MPMRGACWIAIDTGSVPSTTISKAPLPSRRLPFRLISPGSVVATLGWATVSRFFGWYVRRYEPYQGFYGSLGAIILLMVSFYLPSLFLLIGGEVESLLDERRRETAAALADAGGRGRL